MSDQGIVFQYLNFSILFLAYQVLSLYDGTADSLGIQWHVSMGTITSTHAVQIYGSSIPWTVRNIPRNPAPERERNRHEQDFMGHCRLPQE